MPDVSALPGLDLSTAVSVSGTADALVVEIVSPIDTSTVQAAVQASVAATLAYFADHPLEPDTAYLLALG